MKLLTFFETFSLALQAHYQSCLLLITVLYAMSTLQRYTKKEIQNAFILSLDSIFRIIFNLKTIRNPTFDLIFPTLLVNRLAVNQIFQTALEHPFVHLEDVFLTGIIAEKCDIPRRLAIEFRNNAVRIPAQFLGCTLLRTISIHKVLPSEQLEMSKMARNPKCGKNQIVENFRKISSTKSKLPKQST